MPNKLIKASLQVVQLVEHVCQTQKCSKAEALDLLLAEQIRILLLEKKSLAITSTVASDD